jgi:hypothetical protein
LEQIVTITQITTQTKVIDRSGSASSNSTKI